MTPKPTDPSLLKYVEIVNGKYVLRYYVPKKERHKFDHLDSKHRLSPIVLCKADAPKHVLHSAYACELRNIEGDVFSEEFTLHWINSKFKKSKEFLDNEPGTQRQDGFSERILDAVIQINGKDSTFGHLIVSNVTPPNVKNIIDRELFAMQALGKDGRSSMNKKLSYLSKLISWGMVNINNLGVEFNPCKEIKPYKIKSKTPYIEDERYKIQYDFACSMEDTPWLPPLHEFNYMLAARGVESRSMKISQCIEEGIRVERRKGSDDTGILWSDRLREAYNQALKLHKATPIGDKHLIIGHDGGFIPDSTLQSAMKRLRELMQDAGHGDDFFTMHALKAKGVSDAKNDRIAGQSEAMRKMYNKTINWYESPA